MDINYTFDLTSSFNPVNHISLSAKLNLGDRGRQKRFEQALYHYMKGLEYYSAGTEEACLMAINEWQTALKFDETFDPARQGLIAAQEIVKALYDIKSYGVLN